MKITAGFSLTFIVAAMLTLAACSSNQRDSTTRTDSTDAANETTATTGEETTAQPVAETAATSDGQPPQSLVIGEVSSVEAATEGMAPNFVWKAVDNSQWSLEHYRGKVVLLNFWGTWCPPCRRELPDIVQLREELGPENFEVIGVSVGEEPPAGVSVAQHLQNFGEKNSLNYPLLIASNEMITAYGGITAVPTTFIVSASGEITQKLVGMQTKAAFQKAVEAAM